jgi:hypothetical protein
MVHRVKSFGEIKIDYVSAISFVVIDGHDKTISEGGHVSGTGFIIKKTMLAII